MSSNQLKPKNGKLPKWAVALIIVISSLIVLFYAAFIALFVYLVVTEETNSNNNNTIYDTVDNYTVDVTNKFKITNIEKATYEPITKMYVIKGTVVNNSYRDYDFVELEFSLYSKGVKVGTAKAIPGDMDEKESKTFIAVSNGKVTSEIDDYKLLKITADKDDDLYD